MRSFESLGKSVVLILVMTGMALSDNEREKKSHVVSEFKIDLKLSHVQRSDLGSGVCKLSWVKDDMVVTHYLQWLGLRPSWRLGLFHTFSYYFLGKDGKRIATVQEIMTFDSEFVSGKQVRWSNEIRLRPPPGACYLSIEFHGAGLITRAIPIRARPVGE